MLEIGQLLLRKMFKLVLSIAIILSITSNLTAIADTNSDNAADTAKTAAERVVEQDNVKDRFGKSQSGDELLDNARNKASKKLESLSEEAKSGDESLPHNKRLFLRNLEGKN